ncbi:replicative DNA helicase [Gammaproteobacteria bacterium ESL0073]|nr:replicative DNA helicase [Gammaproteobacteria bacterium ESL0073]
MSKMISPISHTLPHSIEAEQSVLGGLMLDNTTFDQVIEVINDQDFFKYDHQVIFKAITHLNSQNQPFDVVTVSEALKSLKVASENILIYLADLARNTPSVANIVTYANVVKERAMKRSLIQIGQHLSQEASKADAESTKVLEQIDNTLFELSQQGNQRDFSDINSLLENIVGNIDHHFNEGNPITGVSTGLNDLDDITSGLQNSDLIIVGARPSMGKTSLGLQLVLAALQSILNEKNNKDKPSEKKHVLVFSLEMPADQLLMRCIAMLSGLDLQTIRSGQLNADDNGVNEFNLLAIAIDKLNQCGDILIIDDNAGLTTHMIRAKTKRAYRKYGKPVLILIDYLQLIAASGHKENRNTEVSAISRAGIKAGRNAQLHHAMRQHQEEQLALSFEGARS